MPDKLAPNRKPEQEQDPEQYALDSLSEKGRQGTETIKRAVRTLTKEKDEPVALPPAPKSYRVQAGHTRQADRKPRSRDEPETMYHVSRPEIKRADTSLKDKSAVADRQSLASPPDPVKQVHIRQKQTDFMRQRNKYYNTSYISKTNPASDLPEAGDFHFQAQPDIPPDEQAKRYTMRRRSGQRGRQDAIKADKPHSRHGYDIRSKNEPVNPVHMNAVDPYQHTYAQYTSKPTDSNGWAAMPEEKPVPDGQKPEAGAKKLKTSDRQTGTLKTKGKTELKRHSSTFKADTAKGIKVTQNTEKTAVQAKRTAQTGHAASQAGHAAAKAGSGAATHAATGGMTVALEIVKKGAEKLQEIAARNSGKAEETEGTPKLSCFGVVAVAAFIPCFLVFFLIFGSGSFGTSSNRNLSPEVLAYMPLIEAACQKHEIPEYAKLIAAIMMQESGGNAATCNGDVMQAAESQGWPAGTPIEPELSIEYGVKHFKACLILAGMPPPTDLNGISLALQGYNFGTGYISWALKNYGSYTKENAVVFSQMQAAKLGWSSYGDVSYVDHVLRYYVISSGSGDLVQVAAAQLGNSGDAYWSWYGFSGRVEWCACFVSWCANECGYIEADIIPKFAGCSVGIAWFKSRNQWKDRDYSPNPGDVIFFDWNESGVGQDGSADHVGIVEMVENNRIYTIEGNSNDLCRRNSYPVGHYEIVGFGVPVY